MINLGQVKQVLKDEGIKALWYFIKGHFLWMIHGRAIRRYYVKVQECKECQLENTCKVCGCEFNPLALSGKKCKINKDGSSKETE